MKRNYFLSVVLTMVMLLTCVNAACKKKNTTSQLSDYSLPFLLDDSVKNILGDSVFNTLFFAEQVQLYEVSAKAVDSLKADSSKAMFHGAYIVKDLGKLNKEQLCPLLFLFSDRSAYFGSGIKLKTPFMPDVALSFKGKDKTVDVIFSFTGGQLCLFDNDKKPLYLKYDYERLVILYFQQYLKNENIDKYLELNIF
ncbi:MAG: hypothetical protein IJ756_08115 [Paludibacteraceae bacterium]|nr:hypothetical protein [Paludibacteraceae bacterium]